MATVTIQDDGTLIVAVTAHEQAFLRMLREEEGAQALSEVMTLWLTHRQREQMARRFDRLDAAGQADLLAKMAQATPLAKMAQATPPPPPNGIPVRRLP